MFGEREERGYTKRDNEKQRDRRVLLSIGGGGNGFESQDGGVV